MSNVSYQTVYLWTCPDCGHVWQLRKRPRTGAALVCALGPEQRRVLKQGTSFSRWCGVVHASTGRRKGIAPNVSL